MKPLLVLILTLVGLEASAETLQVIREIPHSGYSEGLDYSRGFLWNALPDQIVKISAKDGAIVKRYRPASQYSESLCWWSDTLWNVSYSDNGIYAGKLKGDSLVFERRGSTPEMHAWGLTHDAKHLILTGNHGSSKLYFVDPKTGRTLRMVDVGIPDIEDLAWDGEKLWSSSFTSHRGQIFSIDPLTGKVGGIYSLPNPEQCPIIDGIAFDGKNLWVTGKHCTSIFNVTRPSESLLTQKKPKKKAP